MICENHKEDHRLDSDCPYCQIDQTQDWAFREVKIARDLERRSKEAVASEVIPPAIQAFKRKEHYPVVLRLEQEIRDWDDLVSEMFMVLTGGIMKMAKRGVKRVLMPGFWELVDKALRLSPDLAICVIGDLSNAGIEIPEGIKRKHDEITDQEE